MNRWGISPDLEAAITARDQQCIYCGVSFAGTDGPRAQRASWEHIVNDASIVTVANIARCCIGCNASKGAKTLRAWLASSYCQRKGINAATVAQVARDALSAGTD